MSERAREHTGGREVARTERGARIQGSLGSGIRKGRACAGARGEGREKKGNGSPPASSYHLVVLKLLLLLPLLETLLLLVHVSVIRHQALQDVHVLPHGHFGRILHCLVPASSAPCSQLTAWEAHRLRPGATTVPLSVMLSGGGHPGSAAAVPAMPPAADARPGARGGGWERAEEKHTTPSCQDAVNNLLSRAAGERASGGHPAGAALQSGTGRTVTAGPARPVALPCAHAAARTLGRGRVEERGGGGRRIAGGWLARRRR